MAFPLLIALWLIAQAAPAQTLDTVLKDGIVRGGGGGGSKNRTAPAPGTTAAASIHEDPQGFRVALPEGWRVLKLERGQVAMTSPDQAEFTVVVPIVSRGRDCASELRAALAGGWAVFPKPGAVTVSQAGRGLALAGFEFRGGQSRGALLCAETGQRSAMIYGLAAPAPVFEGRRKALLAILRSFRYQNMPAGGAAGQPQQTVAPMALETWQEQTESAFTAQKPSGWRPTGGVLRISNGDVRVGVGLASPDGRSSFTIGDVRLNKCLIPGTSFRPPGPPGAGVDWCPYRNGEQVAEMYVQRMAAEWRVEGLRITGRRPRPDLTDPANQAVARMGGANYRYSYGEVSFSGTRGGETVLIRTRGDAAH